MMRAARAAAEAGEMPKGEIVQIAPGTTITDPGGWFCREVARAAKIRKKLETLRTDGFYSARTGALRSAPGAQQTRERIHDLTTELAIVSNGLETVARWWWQNKIEKDDR